MNRVWMAVVGGVCLAVGACWMLEPAGAADAPAAAVQAQVRLGTYEARDLALAYYRSKANIDRVNDVKERHKKAELAGDKNLMKDLESQMNLEQEAAHRQVFGTGPYDGLSKFLKPFFPAVAQAQKLDAIVGTVHFQNPNVQVVDVTEALLEELKTDAQTREILKEMREQIRTGKHKPEEFKGEQEH
jgi:hypothetical protein